MPAKSKDIIYTPLTQTHFQQVIALGNKVHGEGYLNMAEMESWAKRSFSHGINCSYVALKENKVIAFRCTFAAEHWQTDAWCSPHLWQADKTRCCYFKCNTVDENYRGLGIGKTLLNLSITAAQKQGAQAGVAHLWKQSPNNSAIEYFSRCGGELIKSHPDKWNEDSKQGYNCILCGHDCHCEAAEMIIYFS